MAALAFPCAWPVFGQTTSESVADGAVAPARPVDPNQGEERTSFQTHAKWDPMLQLPADVAMCYGVDATLPERIKQWKERGYITHLMTGVSWGQYQDYLYGRFDGKQHVDEAQTDRHGKVISHGGDVYYMCPGPTFGDFLATRVLAAIEAGAAAVHLEEPEFWARAGYSEGFKRAWKTAYNEDWIAPHTSADAQYRSSLLKYNLYRQALKQVFDAVKADNAKNGRQTRCYVPTHSLINYAQWRIVSPESSLLQVGADGFIAQVWTGTARTPNVYEGVTRERTFETAFLEYGSMVAATRGSQGRLWFLHDPIEDNPSHTWDDYKINWECTVAASLLWPETSRYEIAPWPERIFHGKYPRPEGRRRFFAKTQEAKPIPPAYATELLTVMNALNDMNQTELRWDCGTRGIGIVVSDTMMFQRAEPDSSDEHLGSFYGLALPLLERGMPVAPIQLENAIVPGNLDLCKILLMTYEGMKPMTPAVNEAVAGWVKGGGTLVFVDDDRDPYHASKSWWNAPGQTQYRTPREHLFEQMGLARDVKPGSFKVGQGTLIFDGSSPAALTYRKDGADQVRSLARAACEAAGLTYQETRHLVLHRGPYVIGAGLEGVADAESHELKGRFVDLFAPGLPIVDSVRLTAGKRSLLYDLDRAKPAPVVVTAAGKIYDEAPTPEGGLSFLAVGSTGIEALVRVRLANAPKELELDGRPLAADASQWDEASHTLLIRFPNDANGRKVVIR